MALAGMASYLEQASKVMALIFWAGCSCQPWTAKDEDHLFCMTSMGNNIPALSQARMNILYAIHQIQRLRNGM